MTEKPISMKRVVSRMMDTTVPSLDVVRENHFVEMDLKNGKPNHSHICSLIEACKSHEDYIETVIHAESELLKHGNSIFPYLLERVGPYVKNHAKFISLLEKYELPKDYVTESETFFQESRVIKRTITNHKQIACQANMDLLLNEYFRFKEPVLFVDGICEAVTQYKIPKYAMLNIALEEVLFSNYFYSMAMPKSVCVESVIDNFLNIPITEQDIQEYRKVLKNNKYINENDARLISFLFETEHFADSEDVKKLLDEYKTSEVKSPKQIDRIVRKLYSKSPESIIDGLPGIFTVIRGGLIAGLFAFNPIIGILTFIVDQFIAFNLRKDDINKMIAIFDKEEALVERKMSKLTYGSKTYKEMESYSKKLEVCKDKLIEEKGKLYTDSEIDADLQFNEFSKVLGPVRLNEFKLFGFNNLMRKAGEANKYIDTVYKRAKEAIKDKIDSSIFRPVDESELDKVTLENLSAYINRDTGMVSICVEVFEYNDEEVAHENMTSLCKRLNSDFGDKTCRFYYESNMDGYMDLYIRDAHQITLTEREEAEQADMFAGLDLERLCCIQAINELVEEQSFVEFFTLPVDDYILTEDVKIVNKVKQKVSDTKSKITKATTDGEAKSKEDHTFKGVNLNSIRLAMEGLKKKAKDASAKEQDISRNLDYTVDNFVRSVQKAMTNDRREAIITGSIVPSFSKTLKIALGMAAIGVVNPYLAMITAVGAFANSKRLNHKEKMLLMDEIEIELKIVEKEISMAESDGNTKKLRTLMQYQKKLQREYQRMKYNMKVSWSPMNSVKDAVGMNNTEVTHGAIGSNYGLGKDD